MSERRRREDIFETQGKEGKNLDQRTDHFFTVPFLNSRIISVRCLIYRGICIQPPSSDNVPYTHTSDTSPQASTAFYVHSEKSEGTSRLSHPLPNPDSSSIKNENTSNGAPSSPFAVLLLFALPVKPFNDAL